MNLDTSISIRIDFNTSHVSINPKSKKDMLVFYMYFNTSHVSINQVLESPVQLSD